MDSNRFVGLAPSKSQKELLESHKWMHGEMARLVSIPSEILKDMAPQTSTYSMISAQNRNFLVASAERRERKKR